MTLDEDSHLFLIPNSREVAIGHMRHRNIDKTHQRVTESLEYTQENGTNGTVYRIQEQ